MKPWKLRHWRVVLHRLRWLFSGQLDLGCGCEHEAACYLSPDWICVGCHHEQPGGDMSYQTMYGRMCIDCATDGGGLA